MQQKPFIRQMKARKPRRMRLYFGARLLLERDPDSNTSNHSSTYKHTNLLVWFNLLYHILDSTRKRNWYFIFN